jgi:hypothetical protein
MNNKWIWIALGIVVVVALMVWGVSQTMCHEAIC